jgi:hypothetical protein
MPMRQHRVGYHGIKKPVGKDFPQYSLPENLGVIRSEEIHDRLVKCL